MIVGLRLNYEQLESLLATYGYFVDYLANTTHKYTKYLLSIEVQLSRIEALRIGLDDLFLCELDKKNYNHTESIARLMHMLDSLEFKLIKIINICKDSAN